MMKVKKWPDWGYILKVIWRMAYEYEKKKSFEKNEPKEFEGGT